MERLSIGEMFSKLFEYLGKNPLFIVIFAIFILIYFYLILSPVYTKKHKIIYSIFFGVAIISLIIVYGSEFWKFFDYLMDNIFIALFFPSLTIYMVMVLISIGIFITTMFKEKMSGFVRKLNTFAFLLIIFFLMLSLNVVMTKNVNVYKPLAIYSNEHLLVMIQMTMIIFAFWMLALIIIRIINALAKKQPEEKLVEQEKEEPSNRPVINNQLPESTPVENGQQEAVNVNALNTNTTSDASTQYSTQEEFVPIVDMPIHPYIEQEITPPINDEVVINSEQKQLEDTQNKSDNGFTTTEYKLLHQYLEDINKQSKNGNTN